MNQNNKTVIVTGSQGFIGSFLCSELLGRGYNVVGYDNYSKYGKVARPHDSHKNFHLVELDLSKEVPCFEQWRPSYIILGAAMIGGISYFHKYAFDLVQVNERILANCYDAILGDWTYSAPGLPNGMLNLERVVTISSSMVFEGADTEFAKLDDLASMNCCGPGNFCVDPKSVWPSKEEHIKELPPPISSYGAQKAFAEVWARAAWDQYKIPYTIVRPFNCVGTGEENALGEEAIMSGNVKLMMSHVLPDLVNKCLRGQDPLHILGDGSQVRCYTHGKDIARGIRLAMESPNGHNNDFNISVARPTTVLELAQIVWREINGDKPLSVVHDEPYEFDVKRRVPDVSKARDLLGFEAQIPLEDSVKEVIAWMRPKVEVL